VITREQAEQAFYARINHPNMASRAEIRNLQLEPINTNDIGSSSAMPMVNDDLSVFDLEEAGWKCTFEARHKRMPFGEWTNDYTEWREDIYYVVEPKPGPYVID